ncbi:MAG: tRNA (uridine(34)/cytosine(34)/5-carboxymethylaminomethyluridine(34)-2'-O)-methyltransferase TrmL [Gammaproteobacteria bacterium]|nr:tRNA (uridine(34)/cytosine(34)/5-carboxymethylaminomethyluridine(34)-2'-O)-methyltransferase TrmL [Gammaproteobacteria bacterium]MBU1656247.1 tRNA (uridine(34)/cytosine(34)/5-carboxymethylaminomethyluridine(34)-2'-O)-methyltransferase TrmL [Gammaproteobacteria bacterium]MBU1959812.1 tRNA (uridine(34)/cytosine(34)/5-carboxymethylaminomethyluridine(34)-2'-O)-methyltransferase TrmL [Gammaproteobacteria bacterium]
MCHVVLVEPEIPPNTGNIIRLCANTGARLHLVAPLGFELDDRRMRRAGLDYREFAEMSVHGNLDEFLAQYPEQRIFPCTTKGSTNYADIAFRRGDCLLFGPETRGLPEAVLEKIPRETWLRIPMLPNNRSLNLSNAVAVVVYEAWRQQGFPGKA